MHTQKQKGENKRFSGFSFPRCQPTSQPESDGEPIAQLGEIYFQGVTHENYRTLGPYPRCPNPGAQRPDQTLAWLPAS